MNQRILLQLCSEVLSELRHGNTAADRVLSGYFRERRFIGAKERRFISESYYHSIRHLRRIDEAIYSAFDGTPIAAENMASGFPVSSPKAASYWNYQGPKVSDKKVKAARFHERTVDTLRAGVAAIELDYIEAREVGIELDRCWPKSKVQRRKPTIDAFERMISRAVEVAELYKKPRKPTEVERAVSFPSWLWPQIIEGKEPEEVQLVGESLNQQAPFCIRVNSLRATVDEAYAALDEAQISYTKIPQVPEGIEFEKRLARSALPEIVPGWFEPQDAGSQLLGLYCPVKAGDKVIDACAGGGGKALHLAARMKNEGQIYALDIDARRLANLGRRKERAGATIINTDVTVNDKGIPKQNSQLKEANLVLIDAPCSGTGTIRRNPEAKWRLTPAFLEELKETQLRLLDYWARYVSPGGHLVYATCSLLAVENELQIKKFLDQHSEFKLVKPAEYTGPVHEETFLQLSPFKHQTDGFFAACLQRT